MLVTIIIFVVILGLIVFVHEFGHFIAAKRIGARVEEFGFGLPPRIIGIKKNDTIYSLNWIPVGGFVKIKGEDGTGTEEANSFASKKIWQRTIILSAGVLMNVFLAMVLFSIGYTVGLPSTIENDQENARIKDHKVQIMEIVKGSPAEQAGFSVGDQLLQIDQQDIITVDDVKAYNRDKIGQTIKVTFRHLNEVKNASLVLTDINQTGEGKMGTTLVETGLVSFPWYEAIWRGIKTTLQLVWVIVVAFYTLIKNLLIGQPTGADVAGPIGIAVLTGQVAQLGLIYLLQFTAFLSVNLAIINFLPFPALDGGRVLFLVIEKIRGKHINRRVEGLVHNIGFTLLMLLIIIITLRDINKFKENILSFLRNIF